jgi:site-specific DNA-methyltransferase (adenine-specific)
LKRPKRGGGEKSKAQIEAFTDFWTWDEKAQKTFEYLTTSNKVPERVSTLILALHKFLGNNDMSAYLVMMTVRLIELHRVLKPTGSLYLHCNTVASHYLKLVLDSIFDNKNFINEIVWCYTGPRKSPKSFARKHDTIFFYAKSDAYTFNEQRIKHKSGVHNTGQVFGSMEEGDEEIREELEKKGKLLEDWWVDIWSTDRYRNELLGYPTQKPIALLERIILASSNKDAVILDPFCGCGTTIDATEKINVDTGSNRKWIGIDITHLAINLIKRRLHDKYPKVKFDVVGEPKDLEGARDLASNDRYQFEWWALSLIDARPINDKKKGSDKGIDGIIYFNISPYNRENNPDYTMKALVQVKSGHVNSSYIRDFAHVLDREGAKYGVFITLEEPTSDMKKEAIGLGFNKVLEEQIPKMEIVTIKELIEGNKLPKVVNLYHRVNISYQEAKIIEQNEANKAKGKNKKLADDN